MPEILGFLLSAMSGIIILMIGVLIKGSFQQRKDLNKHIVNFTREITERPDFDQVEKSIEKASAVQCKKLHVVKDEIKAIDKRFWKHGHTENNVVINQ